MRLLEEGKRSWRTEGGRERETGASARAEPFERTYTS